MKYLLGLHRCGAALCAAMSLSLAVSVAHAQSDPPADQVAATAVDREVERIGTTSTLWPRFAPNGIPLAIYTGQRTYLFRHPAPPADFSRLSDGIFVFEGRYPAITANTSADIGGTSTATLLVADLSSKAQTAGGIQRLGAIAIHESFHVFQRQQHPGWLSNEAVAFLYPVDDAGLLALRRLESLSWTRAMQATSRPQQSCWARRGVEFRQRRFAAMDKSFAEYERSAELNEGLASYVELRSQGNSTVRIPAEEFPATRVRDRAYVVGAAMAMLLDGLRPGWQADLDGNDTQYLDQMLEQAIAKDGGNAGRCKLSAAETKGIEKVARADAAAVSAARITSRKQFDELSGWRVIIEGDAAPLMQQGFDPLNVEVVTGGLLHRRFLRAGNANGKLQFLQEQGTSALQVLTEAVGADPLFSGLRRLTIAGLAAPEVSRDGSKVTLRAPGFSAEFTGADLKTDGTSIFVRMPTQ